MRSVLSKLLRIEVNDPRLTGVTVSLVRLSADRSTAKVYFSVIGDEEREREASDGFSAASAFMRRQLGGKMRLRVLPSLFDRLSEDDMLPPTDDGDGPKEDS
jgi:ribosome-binding factor A